jgi:hypothetical protein
LGPETTGTVGVVGFSGSVLASILSGVPGWSTRMVAGLVLVENCTVDASIFKFVVIA